MIVKHIGAVDTFSFLAWSSLFSIPPLALMAIYQTGLTDVVSSMVNASWFAWATILWQSIGNMLIGYGVWNMLLHRYPAASVSPWALRATMAIIDIWESRISNIQSTRASRPGRQRL